jgi:hypothetical protein
LALLCLAAVFFGDVARGIHLLTTRHVVCAAHGELVEADSIVGSGVLDAAGVNALPAEDGADHHEHCSVAAAPTRPLATTIAAAALSGVVPPSQHFVTLPVPVASYGRLVLAYAPKQGPPVHDGSRRL